MKKEKLTIIFGISDFAYQMYRYISIDNSHKIIAFTVNERYCTIKDFCGLPVIPFERIKDYYSTENYNILICIGYNRMNDVRGLIYNEVKRMGYEIVGYRHKSAVILSNYIGEGNIFLEGVTVGLDCVIGNCNIFISNVNLCHDGKIGNNNFFAPSAVIAGHVVIGDNCFLGANCTIKNGVFINDYSLIGASAYISEDTEKYGVYVPIRTVKLEKNSMDITI